MANNWERKAEISLAELFRVLRAVHSRQIEHKITVGAKGIQFVCRIFPIIFINGIDFYVRPGTVFAVPDIFQVFY